MADDKTDQGPADMIFDLTEFVDPKNPDVERIIKNLWNYVLAYSADTNNTLKYNREVIHWLLRQAKTVLAKEPTVLELTTPISVMGPLHGEADSLVTLISLTGKPPEKSYLFLGNYAGMGFAPHETLLLVLALKVRFPKNIHILKGYHEDAEVLKSLDFIAGMVKRQLIPGERVKDKYVPRNKSADVMSVWTELTEVLAKIPLAAVLNKKILCLQGGPGPTLHKEGLERLRKVERPPVNEVDIRLTVDSMWSCFLLAPTKNTDGMPTFTEKDVQTFCTANGITLIVRGRQLVEEGFLNCPKEMITMTSAAAFLDNFRNCGATVNFKKDCTKISIVRYRVLDAEPNSLDDSKPTNGRNAIPLV